MTPDTTDVKAENAQLRRALAALRMRNANLLAAARATLTAARDGETNPLAYLVDELAAHGQLPPADGLTAWTGTSPNPANHPADWNQR